MRYFLLPLLSGILLLHCSSTRPAPSYNIALTAENFSSSGKATCTTIFGVFTVGDCGLNAALEDGKIIKVHHIDNKVFNFLGIVRTNTTIVYGERAGYLSKGTSGNKEVKENVQQTTVAPAPLATAGGEVPLKTYRNVTFIDANAQEINGNFVVYGSSYEFNSDKTNFKIYFKDIKEAKKNSMFGTLTITTFTLANAGKYDFALNGFPEDVLKILSPEGK